MAKSFKLLKEKMSPESLARAQNKARDLLGEIALQDLRKSLHLTQEQIAAILDMKQATISRLESQDDMYISTLNSYITALGGRLKLIASFPDKEVVIDQFNSQGE